LRDLRIAEVVKQDLKIEDGKVVAYRVHRGRSQYLIIFTDCDGAVGHDLAVFDLQILLNHLRDAKVAQSLGCSLDRPLRGISHEVSLVPITSVIL